MKIIANNSILHNNVTNCTFVASELDEEVQTGTRENDSHIEWMGNLSFPAFPLSRVTELETENARLRKAISLQPEWEWNVIDFDNQETFPLEDDPVLCFTDDGLQLLQLTRYGQNVVTWEWTTCFSKPINKSFPIDFVSQWKNVNEPPTK